VPLLAATRSGRQARFAAILEPVRAGTTPSVKAVTLQETPDAMKLTINRDGPTDTVTWSKGRLDVRTRPQP
jgi:hypothetical protein